MQRLLVTALAIIMAGHVLAQGYIDKTKEGAKKTFVRYTEKKHYHTSVTETDTSITFLLRDTAVQNLNLVLHFDRNGKCDMELNTLSCDSCYRKLLQKIIDNRFYNWVAVNNNTYLAGFPYRITLTPSLNIPNAYLCERNDLPWKEYNKLRRKAEKE